MTFTFNIYCDESCHLEHDNLSVMLLGAIWCPLDMSHEIAEHIREIKVQHQLPASFEIKWTKVSASKQRFYTDILDFFFDTKDLHFRALIVPNKSLLHHDHFQQDHDTWYYKMYFNLLKVLLEPDAKFRIYLDIKDTRSAEKVRKLREVLNNNSYDYRRDIVERMQNVRSHEIEQLQLTDFLLGIIGYANRNLSGNTAKVALVEQMRQRSHYTLTQTTLMTEKKVNLFHWEARNV